MRAIKWVFWWSVMDTNDSLEWCRIPPDQLQLEIVTAAVGSAAGHTYTKSAPKICSVVTGSTGHWLEVILNNYIFYTNGNFLVSRKKSQSHAWHVHRNGQGTEFHEPSICWCQHKDRKECEFHTSFLQRSRGVYTIPAVFSRYLQ